jgi:hypothetical protein
MYLQFGWAGTNEWMADLSRIGKELSFGVWKRVGAQIIADFHQVEAKLITSGGSSGKHGTWAALTPKYAEWKAKHYPSSGIMMLTGSLFLSLMGRHPDSLQSVMMLPGGGAVIRMGTAVTSKDGFDYPTAHQKGPKGHKASGKMVARRTIDPTDRQVQEWYRIVQREIVGSIMRNTKSFSHVSLQQTGKMDVVGGGIV